MSSDRPRPELSIVDGYSRKFGRYDFKRFDHLVSQHASLGAASLGKIHVDCRFLFKKSKWGTLEGRDSAGIIYLDLAFCQPSDCRLKSATVQVTLDDDDEHLVSEYPPHGPRTPVQIVSYGPRHMTGEPQYERITTHNQFLPSVDVGPFGGAGGIGRESAKETVRECRWTFESHLMTGGRKRGRKNNWAYKVLQWQITENELEAQSSHSNIVHTAFSFVHGGQPFFMRVEVSGKLESRASDLGQKIKDKMRKLKFPSNPHSTKYAATLIDFNGRHRFTTPLDGLVQGLELAMERDNMTAPVEVKRAQQPRFFDAPPQPPVPPPPIENNAGPLGLLEDHEDPTAPTIENLASLSSRWLTAPSAAPPMPISDIYDGESRRPVSTIHSTLPSFQHRNENALSHESNSASPPTEAENEEERAAPVVSHPSGDPTQLSAGQVDLGTVVFLMRMWMLQALATLLGYGNNGDGQSQ